MDVSSHERPYEQVMHVRTGVSTSNRDGRMFKYDPSYMMSGHRAQPHPRQNSRSPKSEVSREVSREVLAVSCVAPLSCRVGERFLF